MNATVWFIRYTDRNGKPQEVLHLHNCVADYRASVDSNATAQCMDVAALIAERDALAQEVERLQADGVHTCGPHCRRIACVLRRERDALREASTRLVDEVDGLVDESGGVYGLHLNGDMSPWGELLPGGQFERLTSLDDLRAALARAQGVQS